MEKKEVANLMKKKKRKFMMTLMMTMKKKMMIFNGETNVVPKLIMFKIVSKLMKSIYLCLEYNLFTYWRQPRY